MRMRIKQYCLLMISIIAVQACDDQRTLLDDNLVIPGRNWSYAEKVEIPVEIENADIPYNLYVNLRHTPEYKYSNIFLLIHVISPEGRKTTERREFKLALPDGEWLGSGSGNLYSYQIPFRRNFKFPGKGKYIIELEQNMRDNPLDHVTDAGIRIERAD